MPLFDLMRGFFGLPGPHDPRIVPGFRNPIRDGDDEIEIIDIEDDFSEDQFGFNVFSGNTLDIHRYFEQQLDEMMKSFQDSFFGQFDVESFAHRNGGKFIEGPSDDGVTLPSQEDKSNPRNKYLKPSYEQPKGQLKDTDIDNKVTSSNVLDIFPDKSNSPRQQTRMFSSQSIISKRKVLPNGGIEEEKRSVKDGLEEVILSRQLGDLKHIVKTVKQPDGTTERNEEFINFDEDKLSDFNESWQFSKRSNMNDRPSLKSPDYEELPSIIDIFRKFIP